MNSLLSTNIATCYMLQHTHHATCLMLHYIMLHTTCCTHTPLHTLCYTTRHAPRTSCHTMRKCKQHSNQPPLSTHGSRHNRERSRSPARCCSHSFSPPKCQQSPAPTKGRDCCPDHPSSSHSQPAQNGASPSGQSFQNGASSSGLSACTICLSCSPHPIRECTLDKLWDSSKVRCSCSAGGCIMNPQGNVICSDWQHPGGCSVSGHDNRHKCSGCRATDHGAQKCH